MIGNYLPAPKHNKNVWHFLAEYLANAGWSVITTSNKESQLFRLVDMLSTIWRKRNLYQIAQVDVFSGKAFLYAQLSTGLLKLLKKSIVLTLHGGGLPEFAGRHPHSIQRVFTAADVVVTPSAFLQNAFTDIRADIRLIPNAIDISESIYRQRKAATPRLIWVRAFHSVYNPVMAVQVISLLRIHFPDIHLLMIGPDKGDGSLRKLMSLAEELKVKANIDIIGHVAHHEIPQWLDQADIFINTSNYDTAPRSILEAMANGLCVISTNVGGIPFLVSDGSEAILVKPDDAVSMAAAIEQVLKDPVLASHLSERARIRAEKSNWNAILPKWDALFLSLSNSTLNE